MAAAWPEGIYEAGALLVRARMAATWPEGIYEAGALLVRARMAAVLDGFRDAGGQRVTVTVRFSAVCNAPSPATARST